MKARYHKIVKKKKDNKVNKVNIKHKMSSNNSCQIFISSKLSNISPSQLKISKNKKLIDCLPKLMLIY